VFCVVVCTLLFGFNSRLLMNAPDTRQCLTLIPMLRGQKQAMRRTSRFTSGLPDYYAPILGAVDYRDNDEPWMSVQDGSHEPPCAPPRDVDDEWLSFGNEDYNSDDNVDGNDWPDSAVPEERRERQPILPPTSAATANLEQHVPPQQVPPPVAAAQMAPPPPPPSCRCFTERPDPQRPMHFRHFSFITLLGLYFKRMHFLLHGLLINMVLSRKMVLRQPQASLSSSN
jgi:hypothetical protein